MSSETSTDPGLRPWQLFLLAGMLAATAVVLVSAGQTLSSVIVLSLTVVVSSLVAVAGFRWISPLVVPPREIEDTPTAGRARAALEREKALILRTIKEIEFDHAMGKTATPEFHEMRERLRQRAVGLMRRLEGTDYRAAVERDLEARVGAGPRLPDAGADAPTDSTARSCAACRTPNDPDARFCKHCGAPMAEAAG
jgi:hypothetical protein